MKNPRATADVIRDAAEAKNPKNFILRKIEEIRRIAMEEIEPLSSAMGIASAAEPPGPITLPDGRVMIYRGPMPSEEDVVAQLHRLANQIEVGTWVFMEMPRRD